METDSKRNLKIAVVRGAFLNPFELQNYYPLMKDFDITAISSMHPLNTNIDLPLIKLWSPTDLPNFPYKYPILNRLFIDAHYLFGLEKAIAGSDIVHVAETYYGYTHQAILAKRKGLINKIVSTVWEVIPNNNEGIWGRRKFKQLAYREIDHFIAVTNLAAKALLEEGVDETKISVIPMGVDLKRFHPRKILNPKSSILNILFVGRLVTEKGILDLVNAFLILKKTNPDLNLTIIGDGPLKSKLTDIPDIIVKHVTYVDIPNEYQKADIFCLPSRATRYWQEQYGMVLIEALASGLPIITTQTGAIAEVCEDCALYVRPGNPNDLQLKLSELANNNSLRLQLGAQSRKLAQLKYNYLNIAKKVSHLYQNI